jgi:hypothetical protein
MITSHKSWRAYKMDVDKEGRRAVQLLYSTGEPGGRGFCDVGAWLIVPNELSSPEEWGASRGT